MATPPSFTAGSVLTAAQMNAVGLWLVKTDTITSGASKEITSVFSSDYENYRIIISNIRTSATTTVYFRIGTAAGTIYYYNGQYGTYGSATITGISGQGTTWVDTTGVGTSTNESALEIEVYQPQMAKNTGYVMRGTDPRTVGGGGNRSVSGFVNDSIQYTSFSLLTTGAGPTFTSCNVAVYGYRKA